MTSGLGFFDQEPASRYTPYPTIIATHMASHRATPSWIPISAAPTASKQELTAHRQRHAAAALVARWLPSLSLGVPADLGGNACPLRRELLRREDRSIRRAG
jgi:hypothetical protein